MIHRRSLLALPPLLACTGGYARAADVAQVECTTLDGIDVPAARARRLARLKLGGADAVVLAFAADTQQGERDLMAVAARGRVLALEVLSWHGDDGGRLFTRLSAVSDSLRLRLERTASAPRARAFRREAWTDYLAWRGEAPMEDAPVRPVLGGTWQAGLSELRAETRRLLTFGPRGVSPALAAACPSPSLPC